MADNIKKRDSVSTSARHRDAVSPTPWRVEKSPANGNFWVVRCDTGVSLATAWREADAAFIVEAVNKHRDLVTLATIAKGAADEIRLERDRLRDLVLRLADALDTFIGLEDHEIDLLREAREALGEAAP